MSLKTNINKSRVCDQCGEIREYEIDECTTYTNCFGKECRAAPYDNMVIVSIPDVAGRKFLDFCNMKCVLAWASKQCHKK